MADVLAIAVVVLNLAGFAAMGIDKRLARLGRRRVPEAHLLLLAACAGCVGVWLGASTFRHKTRKTSFRVRLVLATLVNGLWIWLGWR